MTRRRWIADEVSGNRAYLIGNHARHLAQVLRAKSGQEFDISTGTEVRRGKVLEVAADRVEFQLGEVITAAMNVEITVAISIFKFDRMEWAIEKCTELGVAKIIPVVADRTEKHLAGAAMKRAERWRRIATQASEQARRISPPKITAPSKLEDVLQTESGARIVLSETKAELSLMSALPPSLNSLALAFGPEGGWKDEELAAFAKAGWTSASLGPMILRAETAVIAAVAVCASVFSGRETTEDSEEHRGTPQS